MSGLLLAGIIIGSLGVLDDVTVTQTSAVWELHQADPAMGPGAVPGGHPDRPGPHRVGRQHPRTRLCGRGVAAAPAVLDRAEQRGHGGEQRAGGGGDRTDPGRFDRTGRLGAGDHGARGAGGLRRPAGGRRDGRVTGAVRGGKGRRRARAERRRRRMGRPGRGSAAVSRRVSSARMRPSASSRFSSKSPSVRSCPSGTSLSVRSRKATSGAAPARNSARSLPT